MFCHFLLYNKVTQSYKNMMFDASDNANENFYVKIKNKKVNTWHYSVNKKRKEGMVTVSVLLKCLF